MPDPFKLSRALGDQLLECLVQPAQADLTLLVLGDINLDFIPDQGAIGLLAWSRNDVTSADLTVSAPEPRFDVKQAHLTE